MPEDWDKFPANTKGDVRCPAKARQRRSELPPPPAPPGSGSQAAGASDAIPEGGHWGAGARLLGWLYGSRRGGEWGRAGGGHGTTEAKLLSKVKFRTKVSWKDFMNITRR